MHSVNLQSITKRRLPVDEIRTRGEAIAASHYVTGATYPWPLTLQRRCRSSGRPWPGRAVFQAVSVMTRERLWPGRAGPFFLGQTL